MIIKKSKALLFVISVIFILSIFSSVDALNVDLISPSDGSSVTSKNPDFKFQISNLTSGNVDCNLLINSNNAGSKTVSDNVSYIITSTRELEVNKSYSWNVHCGAVSAASSWRFNVTTSIFEDVLNGDIDLEKAWKDASMLAFGGISPDEQEATTRFALFLLLIVLIFFSLSKVLVRDTYSRGGKAIPLLASVVISYFGVRYTPQKYVLYFGNLLGDFIWIVVAALFALLLFGATRDSYNRGLKLIVNGAAAAILWFGLQPFFESLNNGLVYWIAGLIIWGYVILSVIGGAGHNAGHIGDMLHGIKRGARGVSNELKLSKRLTKDSKSEIKETKQLDREARKAEAQVNRNINHLNRGESRKKFLSEDKKLYRRVSKMNRYARKLLNNLKRDIRILKKQSGLIGTTLRSEKGASQFFKRDLKNELKKGRSIDKREIKLSNQAIHEINDLKRQINSDEQAAWSELKDVEKIYKLTRDLEHKVKGLLNVKDGVEARKRLQQIKKEIEYVYALERHTRSLTIKKKRISRNVEKISKLLNKKEKKQTSGAKKLKNQSKKKGKQQMSSKPVRNSKY